MIILFVVSLRPVNLQYPFPQAMFAMPPPPMPVPIPVPGPMQVAVLPIPYPVTEETTTTSTTTTKKGGSGWLDGGEDGGVAIAFPIPMPLMPLMPPPMPSLPCMKNRMCPPPPMPFPPFPMPGPGFPLSMGPAPAIMIPFPGFPNKKDKDKNKDRDRDRDDSSSSSSCKSREKKYRRSGNGHDHNHNRRHYKPMRRFNRKRIRINKRKFGRDMGSDNEIKPMLSYISKHGNVKLSKKLSEDDAHKLLNAESNSDELSHDPIEEAFSKKKPEIVMTDKEEPLSIDNFNGRRVMLRGIDDTLFLNQGRKELVFRPRSNKAISNLSVSFLVN